jgi:hypothetical protein
MKEVVSAGSTSTAATTQAQTANTTQASNSSSAGNGKTVDLRANGSATNSNSHNLTSSMASALKPEETIVIHVCDENRKVSKDFTCPKDLLLDKMKYFEKYLTSASSLEDIDISVHCDIKIFEWLMKYVQDQNPKLEVSNVVSILISSDFLQIASLVHECILFFTRHINEVIRLPIDMSCLNSTLVKKLA